MFIVDGKSSKGAYLTGQTAAGRALKCRNDIIGAKAGGSVQENGDTLGLELVPVRGRAPQPLNPRSKDAPGEAAGS